MRSAECCPSRFAPTPGAMRVVMADWKKVGAAAREGAGLGGDLSDSGQRVDADAGAGGGHGGSDLKNPAGRGGRRPWARRDGGGDGLRTLAA